MAQEFKQFVQFLSQLPEQAGKQVSLSDAIFLRKFAEHRHQPHPEDESRTWLSVLMRDGMTDDIRHQLYPSRFDLGNTDVDSGKKETLKTLVADINGSCRKKLQGEKLSEKTKRDLGTVLRGIQKITGRNIANEPSERSLQNLKVVKLMYRLTKERHSHLFSFIGRPRKAKYHKLKFQDAFPHPRDQLGALLFADLLSYIRVEISDDRLARINGNLRNLPETLLAVEKQNADISRILSLRFPDDLQAKALAYRRLAESINTYVPYHAQSTNTLDEAVYTYLRTLGFVHFAGGYEQAIKKSVISREITPVEPDLELLCLSISKSMGHPVFGYTLVTSLNQFPEFVNAWASQVISLIEKATGIEVEKRHLPKITERAKRILHLYCYFDVSDKDSDAACLSVLDCVVALCTVHHEQFEKTTHQAYWHGQRTQAKNVLLQLQIDRRIEDLYIEDYVPHGINQILYNRWCYMHAALVMTKDGQDYLDAWMSLQVAGIKKYAECLRSNDVDVISKCLVKFNIDCLSMAANSDVQSTAGTVSLFDKMDRWLSYSNS
ncbi:hypothetical protein [Rhodanobacter sp. C01]|uniref:hypothetical protein n=1 Tax=Rhodanobacter sp. C01 TaxID=1945856 RepID=UPI00098608B7|nr:hypothetical protein [Rhodanobacter sp. C01]OOG51255.1 hypothetical protein B0E50_00570 [Rhodanobacter sp. C01]